MSDTQIQSGFVGWTIDSFIHFIKHLLSVLKTSRTLKSNVNSNSEEADDLVEKTDK